MTMQQLQRQQLACVMVHNIVAVQLDQSHCDRPVVYLLFIYVLLSTLFVK
jgi:hypothetical protein